VRLFAALDPPAPARVHLAATLGPLYDDRLRWVAPDSLHVTVAFYGTMAPDRLEDLVHRLRRATRRQTPMHLRMVGGGRFGRAVLWVGVEGDVEPLSRLAASAEAAGRRAGSTQKPSVRPFRPHVTVARTRSPDTDLKPYVDSLAHYVGPHWSATRLTLIQSYLRAGTDGRARYETDAEMPFGSTETRS
jgi:RNA 2',3'-cyclic 3'-phosphodiesterase